MHRFIGGRGRAWAAWTSVAVLTSVTVVWRAPQASASADGCDNLGNNPRSCVQVQGSGLYVDWARGGVTLAARGSTRGHFEVWGDGFAVRTQDETLSNESFVGHTKWGTKVTVGRNLPKGSKVCAAFNQLHSENGTYTRKSEACVGIG
jgi:hypothetical protein